jgi:hypothetical protein
VGPLKGFRQDKIPLSEIISRVGGQAQFDAAVLETVLIRAMGDVSNICQLLWFLSARSDNIS